LHLRDLLYLVSSEISTSVKGKTGNGGNIAIDPQLVILNHSSIIAATIEGKGGNITITAGQLIPSADSIVSATSELGISGTVEISPRLDVPLQGGELRALVAVLRDSCAALGSRPRPSLVGPGPIGVPQDPDATLASLYLGGRDRATGPAAVLTSPTAAGPPRAALDLTMACGKPA
jgi:large exoprotein involved in heme utilization and adhesion